MHFMVTNRNYLNDNVHAYSSSRGNESLSCEKNSRFAFSSSSVVSSSTMFHPIHDSSTNLGESSRSSTPSMVSEPISCPPSSSESDDDQIPIEQSIEYYNSMTWCMYYRIMNARKKKASRKAQKAPYPMNKNRTVLDEDSRLPSSLHAQQGITAGLINFAERATGKNKTARKSQKTRTRTVLSTDIATTHAHEDIFHLEM